MGQARSRGSREDRIALAKLTRSPPKPGKYVSTKAVKGMRFIVEDVTIIDEEENEGFFVVSMIDETNANGMDATGDELDPDQWFALVAKYGLERCKVGLYIAPVSERPALLASVVDIAEQIIQRNDLSKPESVFVDGGILGSFKPRDGIQVEFDCDSKRIPGIQLADFVAYHCSYLLKCTLSGTPKKILIEEAPHPLSGEEVDLDWMIRTNLRRHFFVEQRNGEEITSDDWFFKLAGYGAFFSPGLSPQIRSAAEETFDPMYWGCVW